MKSSALFIILWIYFTSLKASDAANKKLFNNSESNLLQYILTNHSSSIRPVQNDKDPVVVRFGIMLKQIIDLDVMNQILTLNVWLRIFWKNELISWNPALFNGIQNIHVKPNRLWVPDIVIFNSATKSPSVGDLYKRITSEIKVHHTGDCQWLSPAIISTQCNADVRYFPFDTQMCELEFGSWTYDGFRVDLQLALNYVDTDQYSVSNEWILHKGLAKRKPGIYSCCPEPYPTALFTLVLKRKSVFYVNNLIVPCGIIALLSLFSFILPPNSGERVSYVMTVLLSLSVYMLMVTETMPHSADIPLASRFFMSMMVQIALSLVATCFIIKLHNNNTPMPPLVAKVINQWLAGWLCMRRNDETRSSKDGDGGKNGPQLFFKKGGFLKEEDDDDLIITRVHDQKQIEPMKTRDSNDKKEPNNSMKQEDISDLIKEVQVIADRLRQKKQEESTQEEWMFACEVLDRFFIGCLCLSISIACVVVFSAVQDAEMEGGPV